jgi:hypothetical protein
LHSCEEGIDIENVLDCLIHYIGRGAELKPIYTATTTMRHFRFLVLLLILSASTHLSIADEEEGDEAEEITEDDHYVEYEGNGERAADGEYQGQDQDQTYKNILSVCSNSVIEVQEISIVCDSPGTYYYGSSKYRNSPSCQAGDKAKLQINFYIADYETINAYGGSPVITVKAETYGSVGDRSVYTDADLCSLSKLKSSSGVSCPAKGYYSISTSFYFAESSYSSNYVFQPNVVVGFKSSVKKNVYDLGGANTNLCKNGQYVTWTDGVKTTFATAIRHFMKTFGILVSTIFIMAGFAFYLWRKPRRPKGEEKDGFVEFDEDLRKAQLVGNNRNVIDF